MGKAHTYLANSKDVISPLTPISKGLAPRRSELGMASLAKPAQAFQSQASMLAITNPVKRSQPLFESAKPSANRLSAIFKMKGGLKQERKNKEVASLLMEQKKQIQHMKYRQQLVYGRKKVQSWQGLVASGPMEWGKRGKGWPEKATVRWSQLNVGGFFS